MRHLKLALLAGAWLAWPSIVLGQSAGNPGLGNDVTVNPIARGAGTLLYPGGQYMRVVRPLLEPGETAKDAGVIHLHMPSKGTVEAHRTEAEADQPARHKRVRQARAEPKPEPATPQSTPEPTTPPAQETKAEPAPKASPARKPVKQARAEPQAAPVTTAPATTPTYNPFAGNPGYSDQGAAGLNFGASEPSAPPPKAQATPKPKQMAKANPPPASAAPQPSGETPTPGLTKRSVILFAPEAPDPAQSALGAIKFLAGDLNASMTSASARVQIQAFGGTRGDKGSDARRLSLKRALAIRQVLIDDGVPAERIDVRAMGGADDSGPADRVDVYVKT
jgi:outer membrane protein OmpA-like peptidoglycan-associated protein